MARRGWLQGSLIASWAWLAAGPLLAQPTEATFGRQENASGEWSLQKAGEVKEPASVDDHAVPIVQPSSFDAVTPEKSVSVPSPPAAPVSHGVPTEVLALD